MSRAVVDPLVSAVSDVVLAVREQAPLVQCVTNFVSMDVVANVVNAVGASPAMVHDPEEAGEFARIASAVAVNIGTPSPRWVEGMVAAAATASEAGTPWVLDPVAVGATRYRRETVATLLTHRPRVVRGNASEILAIATSTSAGRGVDADTATEDALEGARTVARETGAVVVVSGPEDLVTDGDRVLVVSGGDPRMTQVTALGCSATALVAACCAVTDDALVAAAAGMTMLAVAGERAGRRSDGPGSLRVHLLDELSTLDAPRLAEARVTERAAP